MTESVLRQWVNRSESMSEASTYVNFATQCPVQQEGLISSTRDLHVLHTSSWIEHNLNWSKFGFINNTHHDENFFCLCLKLKLLTTRSQCMWIAKGSIHHLPWQLCPLWVKFKLQLHWYEPGVLVQIWSHPPLPVAHSLMSLDRSGT